jgi:soluble lytic murein transglycosylase-like protein
MATTLKSSSPAAGARRARFSLFPAAVLAFTASVLLVGHSFVGRPAAPMQSDTATPVVVSAGSASPAPTQRAGRAKANTDEASVEALVNVTSRKYRISHDAMRELVDTAYREARRNRIDPLLVVAVMAVESRFNPIAQSNYGATGLMQVIPRYHADKFSAAAGESVLDPHTNIRVGVRVLKEYVSRGGNEAAGLQLYNGAARDPRRAYAGRVLAERARLRGALGESRGKPARQISGVIS